jgi:hypothetical protein
LTRRFPRILAFIGLAAAIGCASSGATKITQAWVDPSYAGNYLEKVMVIGVAKEEARRRVFENTMAATFRERGVEALPSWEAIPASKKEIDKETIQKAIEGRGIDAVLITRLVQVDKEQQYVPGTTYVDSYWGSPYYGGGYYPYYSSTYAVVHEPGYVVENTIVQLETNIYDVETEQLLFAAMSETLNPDSVNDAIQKFAKAMVGELLEQRLVK